MASVRRNNARRLRKEGHASTLVEPLPAHSPSGELIQYGDLLAEAEQTMRGLLSSGELRSPRQTVLSETAAAARAVQREAAARMKRLEHKRGSMQLAALSHKEMLIDMFPRLRFSIIPSVDLREKHHQFDFRVWVMDGDNKIVDDKFPEETFPDIELLAKLALVG